MILSAIDSPFMHRVSKNCPAIPDASPLNPYEKLFKAQEQIADSDDNVVLVAQAFVAKSQASWLALRFAVYHSFSCGVRREK